MSDYGVTPTGLNIKRLDVITKEMHQTLTDGWGVNTQLNPESFLNVLVTDIADKIAELWEFGAGIYHAMYPSTAEGTNLDYAVQFSGVTREPSSRSYYNIHCKGTDGTTLPYGTRLSSTTNPVKFFVITNMSEITRSSCNIAAIYVSQISATAYTVSLNGVVYGYTATSGDTFSDILDGIKTVIENATGSGFTCSYEVNGVSYASLSDITDMPEAKEDLLLVITADDVSSSNVMLLSDNLSTNYVWSIISFASEESGDIVQPEGTISNIVTSVAGWTAAWNEETYKPGRIRETDTELRQSYIKKIYNTSSKMTDSIVSALLDLQGVKSASAYENYTNFTTLTYTCTGSETANSAHYFKCDGLYYSFIMPSVSANDTLVFDTGTKELKKGSTDVTVTVSTGEPVSGTDDTDDFISEIYPHSVEVVVDGGVQSEIAETIFREKAAGINTFGSVEVLVPDSFDGQVMIRFSRPTAINVYFNVEITERSDEPMPPNYDELIQEIILREVDDLSSGDDVIPQRWMTEIYQTVTGIAYIDITMAPVTDGSTPVSSDYTYRSIPVSRREKAFTDAEKINISLANGG